MAFNLKDTQMVPFQVVYKDKVGNPAPVQNPVGASSDETILLVQDVTLSADGTSVTGNLVAVGPLGNAQATIAADGDLGDGVASIMTLGDVVVVSSQAVSGDFQFGEPVDKP